MDEKEKLRLEDIARKMRLVVLGIIYRAHASHIGSAYSVMDLLVYLYEKILRINPLEPFAPDRDRFILSKGWGVSALYSVLNHKKIIDDTFLPSYCKDGSPYIGIATRNGTPGMEATTGSMGHGLPVGVGIALAGKLKKEKYRVIVVIGDGELDEGSTWEAILQASHFKLDNLTVIVDANGWQSYGRTKDVLNLGSISDKFSSFGWSTKNINGHDFSEIEDAFHTLPFSENKPSVVIAKTIKGKGVSVFEDRNEWHYQTPREKEMTIAMEELGGKVDLV